MPKKKVHRSRRVRIYSFCFIDSVVPQNIHESCSNWLYNLWKKLYRHPYLPSPIKKFVLRNSLKIYRTTRSWDWERFRDQSFSIAGEEGWGILVETHSFKAKLKCQSSQTEYKEGTPKNWLPISCQSMGGLLEYYRIVCSTRDQVNLIVTQTVSPPLPPYVRNDDRSLTKHTYCSFYRVARR